MPFIGTIAKESDSNFIKNEILKNSKKTKFDILNINKNNVENLKNIKFETIIINENIDDFFKSSKYIIDIFNNAKYLIVNSDILKNESQKTLYNIYNNEKIITFGLNQNATITISSIENEKILLFVQKKFKDNVDNIIDEQEFSIEIAKKNRKKICNSMGIFAILTIYGEKIKKI